MPSPSLLSRRPPPLLLLLLSPWPIWAQAPAAATPTGTPGALDCPEACACAPGGQANCSERALSAVPAGLSRRVRALLLDHNHVRALPPGAFVGAGALRRLDLRENGLRWVHARAFGGLGALQELDLSSNQLEALAPGTFASMRALRVLSLANNRLALLEPAALGALPLLHALSLQDNELPALAPSLLAGLPALNALRLRGNPWACGCSLRPLCAWLRGHPRPAPGEPSGRRRAGEVTAAPPPVLNAAPMSRRRRDVAVRVAGAPDAQPRDRLLRRRLQPLRAAAHTAGPGRGLRARAGLLPRQPGHLPGAGLRVDRLPRAPPVLHRRPPPAAAASEFRRRRRLACGPWEPGCRRPSLRGPRPPSDLSPIPCPPSHSLQASTSDTDQICRDILLGITTARTGSGERCGARQAPGAEGQRAARMGRRERHGLGHGKGWACTRWRAGLRTVPSQRLGKPVLGCMPEEAKRRLSPRGVWRRRLEAARGLSKPSGSRCQLRVRACPWGGQSQFREWGQAEKGEGKERSGSGAEAARSERCSRGRPSQLGPQAPAVALVVAGGGWGFSLCSKPLCLGPG